MDKIYLEELGIQCIIGIFGWERKTKQTILIDFEIPSNIKKAARGDRIEDTLDYKKISKFIIQYVSASRFQLIETLADRLAGEILKKFKLRKIKLRVSKPGAIRGSKNVGIEVVRRR